MKTTDEINRRLLWLKLLLLSLPFPKKLSVNLLTGGEIFQSAGDPLGAPPNTTNIDRMSSALGIGTVAGGACVGPFGVPEPCFTNVNPVPGFGTGSFGLLPEDNVISLSYGKDSGSILQFSVDPEADGLPGTDVFFESTLSPHGIPNATNGTEAAGDIYKSVKFALIGSYVDEHIAAGHVIAPASNLNELYRDELELGLEAPADVAAPISQPFRVREDDLDGFEEADTGDAFWGVDLDLDGAVDPPRTDPSDFSDSEKNAFFSLDALSASIGLTVPSYTPSNDTIVSPDDILVSPGPGFFGIYASGVDDIGLLPNDVLDALVLSDERLGINIPNGFLDRGTDVALFSLQADSPTLTALGFHPGDVFITNFNGSFSLYADNLALGLDNDDELNALDIKPERVPEPTSTLSFLALGTLGAASTLKRKLRTSKSSEKDTTKVS